MKLTAQEAQLAYEALRVVNAALVKHKVDLIREYNETRKTQDDLYVPEPEYTDLDKTFDVQDALCNLLRKLEKALDKPASKKKRKPPQDGKNERRT
jgi:hypothetical protein